MKARTVASIAALIGLGLAGCTSGSEGTASAEDAEFSAQVDAALAALEGQVLSVGPHGEEAALPETVDLTPDEVQQVRDLGATAAIVMHYGGNDWANAQIDGLRSEFGELGIEVVAVTDADFDPGTQVSNIETVMATNPDIIVSIPTDPVATASAYKRAADAGIHLVFMDNVPQGLVAGQDYSSVVSSDNYGNGVVSAHLMARALGGSGTIAVLYHEADFFVTKQRHEGFMDTIADYPDIEVIAERGVAEPDFAGSAQAQAEALLSQNPTLDGIWAVWDVPAEGVMAAARGAGRNDLVITTVDLGKNVAIAIAQQRLVYGLGAQLPYLQGQIEARVAAGALLGREAPPFVAVSALPVSNSNVLDAWEQVYGTEAPADLRGAFEDAAG